MANPYRSSEGLSARQGANADEIQLRIDPVHGDLDEEISGLHSQVKRLKSSTLPPGGFSLLTKFSSAGETDFMKPEGIALLESFVDPVVIHHSKGHTVPRLDGKAEETMLKFVEKIQMMS